MEKTDEQLIIAILQKDEDKACECIEQGAQVNLLIKQKHEVETPDGAVRSLCIEKIETPLMIACRANMHKVIFALLEHGADENGVDKGQAFASYRAAHTCFDFVRESRQKSRVISKHRTLDIIDGQKVRVS